MKKILAAVDFSESSKAALQTAMRLGNLFACEVEALHVASVMSATMSWQVQAPAVQIEQDRLLLELESFIAPYRSHSETVSKVVAKVTEGEINEKILAEAAIEPETLVVMGSHGRTKLKRLFLGSVSSRVLREIKTSVWISKGTKAQPEKILAAVDLGTSTQRVLEQAKFWRDALSAKLTLVHVLDLELDPVIERLYLGPELYRFQQAKDEMSREKIQTEVAKVFGAADMPEILFHTGWPAHEIGQIAEGGNYDLILIGPHERQGVLDFGNTAMSIMHSAQCSVLVVRP